MVNYVAECPECKNKIEIDKQIKERICWDCKRRLALSIGLCKECADKIDKFITGNYGNGI